MAQGSLPAQQGCCILTNPHAKDKAASLLAQGLEHLRAGRLDRAEDSLRKLVKSHPGHRDGLVMLGITSNLQGRFGYAVPLFERALVLHPRDVEALYNLAVALQSLERTEDALARYDQALALAPRLIEALFNRALLLQKLGRIDDALAGFHRAREIKPDLPEIHNQLASLLIVRHSLSEAEAALTEALRLRPDYADAWNNLALVRLAQDRPDEAVALLSKALAQLPDFLAARRNLVRALREAGRAEDSLAEAVRLGKDHPKDGEIQLELGNALLDANHLDQALPVLRHAVALIPQSAEAWVRLARALSRLGQTVEARRCLERALSLTPDDGETQCELAGLELLDGQPAVALARCQAVLSRQPDLVAAHIGLGDAFSAMGDLDRGVEALEQALRLQPDDPAILSDLLCTACYHDGKSLEQLAALNRRAQSLVTTSLRPARAISERPLKIGYVSGDFRSHSVARFLLPLLRHHDRGKVSLHLYSDVLRPDEFTRRFEQLADHWRPTAIIGDRPLAKIIAADEIDILVDLGGHTAGNRLAMFGRRPAPIQLSWLGYGATSGMDAMDYYLCDDQLAPADHGEWFAEQLWRLPRCSFAFEAAADAPDCAPLPAVSRGTITFGSFNNALKITPSTIALWAAVLLAVPNSRLLLKTDLFADPARRESLSAAFAARGISGDRLELRPQTNEQRDHLASYGEVDIALDTSPYNGATTSCEALWMGVPVVSLAGNRLVSRYGASILKAVGLDHLATTDPMGFVTAATALAADLTGLAQLRDGLRTRFSQSSLSDGQGLAHAMEAAFHSMAKCNNNRTIG